MYVINPYKISFVWKGDRALWWPTSRSNLWITFSKYLYVGISRMHEQEEIQIHILSKIELVSILHNLWHYILMFSSGYLNTHTPLYDHISEDLYCSPFVLTSSDCWWNKKLHCLTFEVYSPESKDPLFPLCSVQKSPRIIGYTCVGK